MKYKLTKYAGIIGIISILLATGCTSLREYFKGWIITIEPKSDSNVSSDSTGVTYALDDTPEKSGK